MLLHIILSLILQVSPSSFTLQSDTASNVFCLGESVIFRIKSSSTLPVRYAVIAYNGHTLQKGAAYKQISIGFLTTGYYTLHASQGNDSVSEPISVVYPVQHKRDGPIAVDAADCWLVKPDEYTSAARLLSKAGFGWVRERLLWAAVEPERGVYHWGSYDACINSEVKAGLLIDDIFHSIPTWARADHATNRFPDDLRDAYQFCKTLAVHFKGKIEAWEVWNEADGGFSVDNADAYAAFLKACYLGFKAGDRQIRIAQVSFANPASEYETNLYQNDTQSYFDIYNYHVYADPMDFSTRANGHFELLNGFNIRNKPVWVTEAGISLPESDGGLNEKEQREQAEFIPKAYAMSLATGTNKHFYFVFPYYLENGVEFGTLTKLLMPLPGYSALAASTHFLGRAKYLGRLRLGLPSSIITETFQNATKGIIVIWSSGSNTPVSLNSSLFSAAKYYNCVGSSVPNPTALGESPLFVTVPLKMLRASVTPPKLVYPKSNTMIKPPALAKIVLRLTMPDNTINRSGFDYMLQHRTTTFQLQIYNFSNRKFNGVIHLSLPRIWHLTLQKSSVNIPPMGLVTLLGKLITSTHTKMKIAMLKGYVTETGNSDAMSSPICLRIEPDIYRISPTKEKALKLANASSWRKNVSPNGIMSISEISPKTVMFSTQFDRPGDSWAYPVAHFNPPANFSTFNALEFWYRTSTSDTNTQVRVMIAKSNGPIYYTAGNLPASSEWREAIVSFQELSIGGFSPPDPDRGFHAHHVSALMIGVNTKDTSVSLQLKGLEVVHFNK